MNRKALLLPLLAGFFVMGFGDIIGTVMNQVKAECSLSDVTAGFLPSMIFIWFFLISIPTGVLSGRIGRPISFGSLRRRIVPFGATTREMTYGRMQ